MAKFIIFLTDNKKYRFKFISDADKTILESGQYDTMDGCKAGIQVIKNDAGIEHRYKLMFSPKNGNYFRFIVPVNNIIAVSAYTRGEPATIKNMEILQQQAANAEIILPQKISIK